MVARQDIIKSAYKIGTDTSAEDSAKIKFDALQKLVSDASEENVQAQKDLGFAGSMDQMVNSLAQPRTSLGSVMLKQPQKNFSNNTILSEFQAGRAKGTEDKLKTLLDQFKTGVSGENVLQGYGDQRISAINVAEKGLTEPSTAKSGNLENRKYNYLDRDVRDNYTAKRNEIDTTMSNLDNMLANRNLPGFNTAATVFLRNVSENKGSLSDMDVARELPATLAKKWIELKQFFTSNRIDTPLPKEYIQPMKDIVQAVSAGKKRILNNYLDEKYQQYKRRPDYQGIDIDSIFQPLGYQPGAVEQKDGTNDVVIKPTGQSQTAIPSIDDIRVERERRKAGK